MIYTDDDICDDIVEWQYNKCYKPQSLACTHLVSLKMCCLIPQTNVMRYITAAYNFYK